MRNLISFCLLFPCLVFAQGSMQIHLKSGSVMSSDYVYLDNGSIGGGFVRINDKRNGEKIKINEVDHIEGIDQEKKHRYFKPVRLQASTIWAERTYTSSRIAIYYTNVTQGGTGDTYKSRHFQYAKDDGPTKKLKYSNLRKDVGDNKESMAHLKKAQGISLIQGVLWTAGGVLVIGGTAAGLEGEFLFGIPSGLLVGLGLLAIPTFLYTPKQKHFVKALEVYK